MPRLPRARDALRRTTCLKYIIPFDEMIGVHRMLGYVFFVGGFAHSVCHFVAKYRVVRFSRVWTVSARHLCDSRPQEAASGRARHALDTPWPARPPTGEPGQHAPLHRRRPAAAHAGRAVRQLVRLAEEPVEHAAEAAVLLLPPRGVLNAQCAAAAA